MTVMGATHYSEEYKARMVQRMLLPGGPTAMDVARETNVPHGTLCRWRIEAGKVSDMGKKRPPKTEGVPASESERDLRSSREWAPSEKLRVIAAASQLKDDELGALLRREGIHLAQLEEWRSDMLASLGRPTPRSKGLEAKRIRELEREVARKDKALAEITALLVLQKKLQALFASSAEEGDSTDDENEKK